MGAAVCFERLIEALGAAEWIDLLGIVINVALTVWIVKVIQNRLTNKRTLKDFYIADIKDIRTEYADFLKKLHAGLVSGQSVLSWFKSMNMRVNDLMQHVSKRYGIDKQLLNPYQNTLRDLITDDSAFELQYTSEAIKFSEQTRSKFYQFEQRNSTLFYEIIGKINDAN